MTRCQKLLSGGASGVDTGCDMSGMQCSRPLVVGSCISIAAVTVICAAGNKHVSTAAAAVLTCLQAGTTLFACVQMFLLCADAMTWLTNSVHRRWRRSPAGESPLPCACSSIAAISSR